MNHVAVREDNKQICQQQSTRRVVFHLVSTTKIRSSAPFHSPRLCLAAAHFAFAISPAAAAAAGAAAGRAKSDRVRTRVKGQKRRPSFYCRDSGYRDGRHRNTTRQETRCRPGRQTVRPDGEWKSPARPDQQTDKSSQRMNRRTASWLVAAAALS